MMDADIALNRKLLSRMHDEIRKLFPDIRTPTKEADALRTSDSTWTVEIVTYVRPRLVWTGRAGDAYEARYKAWSQFRRTYGPANLPLLNHAGLSVVRP